MITGPKIPNNAEAIRFASGLDPDTHSRVSVRWYRSSRQRLRDRRVDWVQVSAAGSGSTTAFSGKNLLRAGPAYDAAIAEAVERGVSFTGAYCDPLFGR